VCVSLDFGCKASGARSRPAAAFEADPERGDVHDEGRQESLKEIDGCQDIRNLKGE
jgi:hypothetical protein